MHVINTNIKDFRNFASFPHIECFVTILQISSIYDKKKHPNNVFLVISIHLHILGALHGFWYFDTIYVLKTNVRDFSEFWFIFPYSVLCNHFPVLIANIT